MRLPCASDEVISRAATMGVGLVSACRYYLENECSGKFVMGYADLVRIGA